MSSVIYVASDTPITGKINPHDKMVSVNEALELGIEEIPPFMLEESFDRNKAGVLLVSDREVIIDIDTGVIVDGDYDDDFAVIVTEKVHGMRTEKAFCAIFECMRCTQGRIKMFIKYLEEELKDNVEIELWHTWLDNEPYHEVITREIAIADLTVNDILELDEKEVWQEPFVDYCYLIRP